MWMVGAYAEKWMSARLAVDGMKPAEVCESQAGDYPSLPSSVIKKSAEQTGEGYANPASPHTLRALVASVPAALREPSDLLAPQKITTLLVQLLTFA